jgi:hypothetical protein
MAAVEEEEGEEEIAAPTEKRRRRRKKRIRLTDSGLKAKRKAERRDKLMAERLARGVNTNILFETLHTGIMVFIGRV